MADGRNLGFDSISSQAPVADKKRGGVRSERRQGIVNSLGAGFTVTYEEEDENGCYITIQHFPFLTNAESIDAFKSRMQSIHGSRTQVKTLEENKYLVIVPK